MTILERYKDLLAPILRPVVFEIGAAQCEDTLERLFVAGKSVDYHAFEPDRENLAIIAKTEVSKLITVVPKAVGDRDGQAWFYPTVEWKFSGSLKQPMKHLHRHPWIKWGVRESVEMVRLDTYVKERGIEHIDFIWCDVQGAEDLVIAGGQEALRRTSYLYTEYIETEDYEGQIPLAEIRRRLPGEWLLLENWFHPSEEYGDALLQNISL